MEDLYGPLDEKKKKRKKAGTESSKESSLRDWFGRKGAKGKKKGWVDCNAPDGKGGYKSCGRSGGEKRKKYPACRPTPGACKERGKGKSWGKKAKKRKNEEITMDLEQIVREELEIYLSEAHSKKDEEELKKISDELKGASKMHKGQADRIDKILDSTEDEDLKEGKKNCGCGQDPCKTYGIQENTDAEIDKEDSHEMQRVNDELLSDLQDIDMDWIMDDENMYRMLDGFKRDSKTPDEYQQKIKLFLNKNANKFGYGGLGDEVFNEELEAVLDEKRKKKKKKKKKSGKKDACYHKVKSRYKVWTSAYASGALVKCRKVGAKNWGNSKKEQIRSIVEDELTQLLEIEEETLDEKKNSKCTKVTKKASSTRKGKKWMKCVKSDSGGYKRIHWGQAGVRVTGKSGNTKRKKSFKARHGCKGAKANTPKGQACKDWAE